MNTSLLNCCNIFHNFKISINIQSGMFKNICIPYTCNNFFLIFLFNVHVYACDFFLHVKRYDSLSYICINYLLIILSKNCCMTTICLKSCLIFWLSLINFLITICDRKFLIIIILLNIYIFHSDLFLSKRHSWCLKGHNHNDGVFFYFYCSQLYFFKAIIMINQNASVVEKL